MLCVGAGAGAASRPSACRSRGRVQHKVFRCLRQWHRRTRTNYLEWRQTGDSPNISFNQQIKDLKDNTREPLSIKCGEARSELSGRVQPDRARVFSIAEVTRFNRDLYRGVIYKFRENANNRFSKALLWLRESFANLPSLKGADKALRKIREQFRVLMILLYCGDSWVINEDGKSVSYLESFGIRTVSEAVRVITFNFFTWKAFS